MKKLIFTMLILVATTISFAEDKLYPLDIQMRVWSEEIRYGDPCFLTFTVTNQGPETLLLPFGRGLLHCMAGKLFQGEKRILLLTGFDHFEGVMMTPCGGGYGVASRLVKPGETMKFHVRMTWLPLPEFADGEQAKEFLQLVHQGNDDFILRYNVSYVHSSKSALRKLESDQPLSPADFPTEELDFRNLDTQGYKLVRPESGDQYRGPVMMDQPIRILPRSQEEIDLIQAWYLELPTAADYGFWTYNHVFAHPFHVNGSPYNLDEPLPLEEGKMAPGELVGKKRSPFDEAYSAFFASLQTRTPEVLARIKRTNELAAQILERAKQPGSTISQNMVEFIQLRGFLVDMRYAENSEMEEAAFVKLMDFVDQSQDKELWVSFFHETGLSSIWNFDHFPWQKVNQYSERFAERFQIPKRGVIE